MWVPEAIRAWWDIANLGDDFVLDCLGVLDVIWCDGLSCVGFLYLICFL